MRSLIFNLFFYLTTTIYILSCLLASLIPGRQALMAALKRYTKLMVWGMRRIGGINIQIVGKENIPVEGPVIIAAKHQSYGDGFAIFTSFEDLSFVTGDMDKDSFMALLQDRIESRSLELLDLDNPGALDPANIGRLEENSVARAKRLAREAEEG